MTDSQTLGPGGGHAIELIESRLSDSSWWDDRVDGWLDERTPALSRGEAWVIPLVWDDSGAAPDSSDSLNRVWLEVRGACEYRAGWPTAIPLGRSDGETNGYVRSLIDAGAYRADWWALSNGRSEVAVALVCTSDRVRTRSLALHVVPTTWLREKAGAKRRAKVPVIDLSWSLEDLASLPEPDERPS